MTHTVVTQATSAMSSRPAVLPAARTPRNAAYRKRHVSTVHPGRSQPHQSWGLFLQLAPLAPSRATTHPYRRSHRREQPSPSWFSQAQVCGTSSLPFPSPRNLCWRCPRTDPSPVAPCRTTGHPSCSCLERLQPHHAAWRVLHPTCFLGEEKKKEFKKSQFCAAASPVL